jgi:5-methylcytosine-specific restriction endonuclease McrA
MTRDQEYYLSNRKEIRRKQAVYRLLHREEILKQRRDERKNHLEAHKAKDKQRAPQHKAWRKKHEATAKFKAHRRAYRRTIEQRAHSCAYSAACNAKRFGAPGSWTGAQFLVLYMTFGNVCLCCHKKRVPSPDHVVPLCKGGTNYLSNIQPLCWPCNKKKKNKSTDYRKTQRPTQ